MLTHKDINTIANILSEGNPVELFFVINENMLSSPYNSDEVSRITNPKAFPVSVKVLGVTNAYVLYMDYVNNPDKYTTMQRTIHIDPLTKYVYYYHVLKSEVSADKVSLLTPAVSPTIFGQEHNIFRGTNAVEHFVDPSPISPIYIQKATAASESSVGEVDEALDWKYYKLKEPITISGFDYEYVTSNWYQLQIDFPTVYHPLINVTHKNPFFTSQ